MVRITSLMVPPATAFLISRRSFIGNDVAAITRCPETLPLKRVRGTWPMASGILNFELVRPSISRCAAGDTSPMNCMNRMGWFRLFM